MAVNTSSELKGIGIKTRPSNYGVNQVSIGTAAYIANATTLVSTIVSTDFSRLYLTRSMVGQTISATTKISVATGASNYRTYTVQTAPHNLATNQTVIINGASSATFDYPAGGVVASVISSAVFSILATGASSNVTGGDLITFPNAVSVWSTTTATSVVTTTLGVAATYTVFDYGDSTATENNPGKGVVGTTAVQGKEAFYSLFIYDNSGSAGAPNYRRVKDFSQVFTKDYGSKSTMLNSLPDFYKKTSGNLNNTDFDDFIALFAFEYDTWRTQADLLFDYSDPDKTESTLLVALLKQFGVGISSIGDYSQARKTLQNIIRSYKGKGSYDTMDLVAEMITGYDSSISATPDVNLLPDQNATSLVEGNAKKPFFWTINPGAVSGASLTYIGGVGTDRKPAVSRVGGKFDAYGGGGAYGLTPLNENGVLRLKVTNTGTAFITGAPRSIVTTSASTNLNATVIKLQYGDVYVNDYVIGDPFPYGTYITAVDTPTATGLEITVSNGITATINASTTFTVTSAGPDVASAYSKLVPVTAGTTYAWSLYANTGSYTAGPITSYIYWYKINGDFISSNTLATPVTAAANWSTRVSMTAVAPANAAYAAPAFSILRSSALVVNSTHFFDAFQFEAANAASTFTNPSKTVIISTSPATRPRDTSLESRFRNIIPSYVVNGFLPQTITATTHSVIAVSDPSTLSDGIVLQDPVTGVNATYPTATITLQTATTNIVVGQSFSLKGGLTAGGSTTRNDIDYGIIIGVISTKEYRILARSISGTTLASTTTTWSAGTAVDNNLYTNVVHQPTWTIYTAAP